MPDNTFSDKIKNYLGSLKKENDRRTKWENDATALANERNTNRAEGLARGSAEAARRAQTQWQQDATALANERNTNRAEGLARGSAEAKEKAIRSPLPDTSGLYKPGEVGKTLQAYRKATKDEHGDIRAANKEREKSLFDQAGDAISGAWNNSGYLGKGAMIGAAAAAAGAIGYGSYKLVKHIVNKFKNKVANSKDSPQAKRAAVNSMINEINTKISKAKSSEEKHELMKSKAELQETLTKIK